MKIDAPEVRFCSSEAFKDPGWQSRQPAWPQGTNGRAKREVFMTRPPSDYVLCWGLVPGLPQIPTSEDA